MATLFSLDFDSTATMDQPMVSGAPRTSLRRMENLVRGMAAGTTPPTTVTVRNSGVRASGTLTLATSSGTVGGVINGVTVTVAWASSDTATAAAIAAAINASSNALVQDLVTATSSGAVVTVTAVVPGKTGNCITLAASGTNVTASGARLTAGSESRYTVAL